MRRLPLLGCLAIALIWLLRPAGRSDPLPNCPRLVLWAWESPQDLRFIQPGSAGIAFLERTVWLDGERVRSRPRLQPLRYTPGADLIAVVRFESVGNRLPTYADVAREVSHDRFLRFWNSTEPVDTALAAALRMPVGDWTERWQRRFVPRLPLGAAAPLAAAVLGILLAGAAIIGAALSAARRQVG